jgi:hypothetical protein
MDFGGSFAVPLSRNRARTTDKKYLM